MIDNSLPLCFFVLCLVNDIIYRTIPSHAYIARNIFLSRISCNSADFCHSRNHEISGSMRSFSNQFSSISLLKYSIISFVLKTCEVFENKSDFIVFLKEEDLYQDPYQSGSIQ